MRGGNHLLKHLLTAAAALLVSGTAEPVWAGDVAGRVEPASPVTDTRIAGLPVAERAAWAAYLAQSRTLMAADKATLAAERAAGPVPDPPPAGPPGARGMPLDMPTGWYAGTEALRIADNIVSFQTPAGGWGKNQDRRGPPRLRGQHYVPVEKLPPMAADDIQSREKDWRYVGTIDNDATTSEMRFLARVQAGLPGSEGDRYRAAFLKGLRYLLAAQYPNGGWPQVYPLQGGYHDAITYNDGAVARVAELLFAAASGCGDYSFVPEDLRRRAGRAAVTARDLIVATQVRVGGRRTIWGQQHDALTLEPVAARNFEPAALSSDESADLLLFLMDQPDPSPSMREAIAAGVAWLDAHGLRNVEWMEAALPEGRRLVPMSCPLLSGPSTMTVWIEEGTTNASEEAQARGDHRQAA